MKKIILSILMVNVLVVNAQEIQIQTSKNTHKFVTEYIGAYKNNTFYAYGELTISEYISTYIQTFHEYNLGFVNTHVEYRSMLCQRSEWNNIYIAGLSFPICSDDKYHLTLSPLYRYDDVNQWQATAIYGFSFNRLTFEGYFDLYGDKHIYAFSENKFKLYFEKYFVGTNIEYYLESSYSKVTPYVMVGIKF
jgi:hypothetical protein